MNEKYLYDLIDEALHIQRMGGDLEAFYAQHEDYRTELMSLIAAGSRVSVLKMTAAPETLRTRATRITAHDQHHIPAWHTLFAPHMLTRAAAFAVLVIMLGSGFAYRQNSIRNDTLAAFDEAKTDHQNFLNTVGEQTIVAVSAPSAMRSLKASPEPESISLFATSPVIETPPALPPQAPAQTGVGVLYDEQSALEALQKDLDAL